MSEEKENRELKEGTSEAEAQEVTNEQVEVDTPVETTPEDVVAENEEQEVRPAVEAEDSAAESMSDIMNDVVDVTPGDLVQGEVLTIDNDKNVVVGLGGGQEGIIPIRELSNERVDSPSDVVSVGDVIDVVVLRDVKDKEQGSFILSKKRVDQRKAWEDLQEKYNNGETIEAPVTRVVKGGVTVDAGVRGFVPASQIDTHFVSDLNQFEGNTYEFKILEIDPQDRQLILSRKAILEESQAAEREEALENLEEGSVVTGTVVRLTNFGAFVNLGGVDGLVHVSEIAHERIGHPSEKLEKGDEVEVKVLKVDKEQERVSLSIKETLPGPWDTVEEEFAVGSVVTGTVKRVADFGAFVELKPGVEGLVHISELAHKHVETPHEVVANGEEVEVKVLDVDSERERVSLSIKALQDAPEQPAKEESTSEETEEDSKPNVKQPSLRDEDEEGAFTLGDQIGDKLAGLVDDEDEE
jgi:small subunit ribosomal protein S1